METITVTTKAGVFEFRVEERVMDSFQIEQTAVKYAGGYENLSELKLLSTKYYDAYQQKLKEVFTEEGYREKISVIKKGEEAADEKRKVAKEFIELAAPEFIKFSEVNSTLENVYKIARAAVLQVRKQGVPKIEELSTDKVMEIIEKLEEELIFFRREEAPTTSDNAAHGEGENQ